MKGTSPLVPWYISNRILSDETITVPMQFSEELGVLFTDVCSFTKLTEFFSSSGHYGVEGITIILEQYFTIMIACIHKNRGSLIKLGGDSLLAVFPGSRDDSIKRMVQCGKDMFTDLALLNNQLQSQYGTIITFRGGGAYGTLTTNIVGDERYHLDYYFVGPGMEKALEMEEKATPGRIKYDFEEEVNDDISNEDDAINKDNDALSKEPYDYHINPVRIMSDSDRLKLEKLFISDKIIQRVLGQMKFKAELKNAAIVFLNLHKKSLDGCIERDNQSVEAESDYIDYRDYHELFTKIQDVVYSLDGNINKIDVNEKGYLILITFGVPNIHNDDIERAFVCAYRLSQIHSPTIGLRSGITYSNIFAGNFGSKERFEYGIIGNGVNAAARLMAGAASGEITFSEEIITRISSRFESEFVEEITVKGFTEPIKIHRLKGELPENWKALSNHYQGRKLIVKEKELQEITSSLLSGEKPVVRLYGTTGVGKTFFIYCILEKIRSHLKKFDIIILEEFNALGKLDYIFKLISRKLQITSLERDFAKIVHFCNEKGIKIDKGLLLERFANFSSGGISSVSEVAESRGKYSIEEQQLKNEIFFNNLQDIVIALLSDTDLMVIDNFQWLDAMSKKILSHCIPLLLENGLRLIVSVDANYREEQIREKQQDFLHFYDKEKCSSVELTIFNPEQTKQLIIAELSAATTYVNEKGETVNRSSWAVNVNDTAIQLCWQIANGNPLFLTELLKVIKNNFDYQQDMLTDGYIINLQRSGVIPPTMESLFLRQFERLDEKARYLLMIASIIGSSFSLNDLLITDKEQLQKDIIGILTMLNKNQIIDQKGLNPEIEYIFSNTMMRESIYRTILMSEKRDLHERIARYYEDKYADKLYHYSEIIANHYIQTENNAKKVYYCRKAAEKNVQLYFLDESLHYYEQAINFTDDEALKLEMEMDSAIITLLQGKINEVDTRIKSIEERLKAYVTESLTSSETVDKSELYKTINKLEDYYLFLKVRAKIYKSDYQGVLEAIEKTVREVENREFRNMIESYRLDSLRFLHKHQEFKEQAFALMEKAYSENDTMLQATTSSLIGQYYLDMSDYKNAKEFFEKKLQASEKINDRIMVRQALNSLGVAYSRSGNKSEAKEFFEKAREIAEKLGDRNGLTRILMNLGILYKNEGKYDKAMDCYYQSLRLTKVTLNKQQESIILYNIGEAIFHQSSEYDKAMSYFHRSLAIAQSLNDNLQVTYCYDAIGDMTFHLGRYDEAQNIYEKNLAIQQTTGDQEGIAHTFGNLGNIAKARKDYETALNYYRQQQEILVANGDKDGEGRAWFNMAMVDIDLKKYIDAREKLSKALALFEDISAQFYIDISRERLEALDKHIKSIK